MTDAGAAGPDATEPGSSASEPIPFARGGGVLPGQEIRRLAETKGMIKPFAPERLKPASYDLSVGNEYYLYRNERGDSPRITQLRKGDSLAIPPNAVCYVLTGETVCIPHDVAGLISLRVSLLSRGLVMPMQGQIDPGYTGKIVAMLYNLSDKPVMLGYGDHVITIQFHRLEQSAEVTYGNQADKSDRSYQGLDKLEKFMRGPINSSLRGLASDLEGWRKDFYNFVPHILAALAISVAVITIVVAIPTIAGLKEKTVPQAKSDTIYHTDTVTIVKVDTVRVPGQAPGTP
jgi:deoxycytidine triphosphate deaminase